MRTVTTTMRVAGGMSPRAPVKTARPVPKDRVFEAMQAINAAVAKAPVAVGETLASNLLGLGIDVVATKAVARADGEEKLPFE